MLSHETKMVLGANSFDEETSMCIPHAGREARAQFQEENQAFRLIEISMKRKLALSSGYSLFI